MSYGEGSGELSHSPLEVKVPRVEMALIPREELVHTLGLDIKGIPQEVLDSLQKGDWYSVDGGKTVLNVRKPEGLAKKTGMLYAMDIDDTALDTTHWHQEEFLRLSENEELKSRGVDISSEKAANIYELSKIRLKDLQEPRYTPHMNYILATEYTRAQEAGLLPDEAWEKMLVRRDELNAQLEELESGEELLCGQDVDETVVKCFTENSTAPFVYTEFVNDILNGTDNDDVRAIFTRGDIGGQVQKVAEMGILDKDRGFDMVIYTGDLKAGTLPLLYQFVPQTLQTGTRVYDDNLKEVNTYVEWAIKHDVKNVEVVGVKHAGAKARGGSVTAEPVVVTEHKARKALGPTTYTVYFASDDVPERDLAVGGRVNNTDPREE